MAYTEKQLERIDTDHELRRAYLWQVGQKALLKSVDVRRDDLNMAQTLGRFGRFVLDNIDQLTETTGS